MRAFIVGFLCLAATPAGAAEAKLSCPLVSRLHDKVVAEGTWQALPHAAFLFLQGAYYVTPPRSFPRGQSAVLVTVGSAYVVFFIDGPMACSPFPIPEDIVKAIGKIANGEVFHDEEGKGL